MRYLRGFVVLVLAGMVSLVFAMESAQAAKMPRNPCLRQIYQVAQGSGYLKDLNRAIQKSKGTRLNKEWNMTGEMITVADINPGPLAPKTGDYAETPIHRPPKDEKLKEIYKKAEEGGYLDDLEKSIEKNGGERLKKKWNEKEDY